MASLICTNWQREEFEINLILPTRFLLLSLEMCHAVKAKRVFSLCLIPAKPMTGFDPIFILIWQYQTIEQSLKDIIQEQKKYRYMAKKGKKKEEETKKVVAIWPS